MPFAYLVRQVNEFLPRTFLDLALIHICLESPAVGTAHIIEDMYSEYPEILEVKDLCEILGYGKKKVYQLIKEGQLKKIPCGRTIKVAKATIIDFVLQCAQK